jgi:4-hydroxythreonine-4-phosphate dehydrogenase
VKIGLTLGDPAGVGPELVARAVGSRVGLRVYGDRELLERAARSCDLDLPAGLDLVEVTRLDAIEPGRPTAASGRAQIEYLEAAIADALDGQLAGICTAPLSKASAVAAGFEFPGQTELLAARAGVSDFAMMLAGPRLRVVPVTTHRSVADAARFIGSPAGSAEITRVIALTARALEQDFGVATPRIAVSGLNPHAGEGGLFGREEIDVIGPAVAAARSALQARIDGPAVPDVVFREAPGRHDAVVCMLHDQGLIAAKLLDFEATVNITLGLPFVRTSPDHGVAYDIAGKGVADASSMKAAIRLALEIDHHKHMRDGRMVE